MLSDYIQQTPGLQLVRTCPSALEVLPLLSRGGIDLLFLDLQLPGLSGPAFIQALPQPPAFICPTAYPEYAAASYDWEAVDYLLKPIAYARFAQSLAKYWHQTGAVVPSAPHTYFKVNGRLLKLLHADLVCAQSVNHLRERAKHQGLVRKAVSGPPRGTTDLCHLRQRSLLPQPGVERMTERQEFGAGVSATLLAQSEPD